MPVKLRRPALQEKDGDDLPEVQALRRLIHDTGQTSNWSSMLVKDQLAGTPDEDDDNYVYGEINIAAFSAFLRHYAAPYGPDGVFYDMGCGAGKAVLAAALCPHFKVAYGAEILQCTFDVAEVLVKMLKEDILPSLRPDENVRVGVFHDSIFNRPELVREADVAYANCVTWPNDTMTQLAAIAEGMRPGSLFITCSVPLSSPAFALIELRCVQFGWGAVTVYIQERMPYGTSWQSRRLLRPDGPPVDYLLDVPSLIAAGALAFPGAKSSAGSTAAGALVAVGGSDRVLVASCARSGVPEEIVAMGVDRVSAFDWDVNAIAELAAAKEAAKAAAAAGGAAPSSAPRATYLVGDVIDPVLHEDFTHGVPARIPDEITLWDCLLASAFDVVVNQTILDVILSVRTRTPDLVEEELRREMAERGLEAASAGGGQAGGEEGGAPARRMRSFGARLAHKALTSLCTVLRPGGTALFVARAGPEVALPALTTEFGLPWDVEHREIAAVPSGDPGAGPLTMHLYACRKRQAECVRVSGHRVVTASHPTWDPSCGRCSFAATGKAMFYQEMFECITCGLEAVCAVCVRTCHAGHDTKGVGQYGRYESSVGSIADDDAGDGDGEGGAAEKAEEGACEVTETEKAEEEEDDEEEEPTGPLGCKGEGGWMARSDRGERELGAGDSCTGFCDCGFSGLCLAGAVELKGATCGGDGK